MKTERGPTEAGFVIAHIDISYSVNNYLKVLRMVMNNKDIFHDEQMQGAAEHAVKSCVVYEGKIHCLESPVQHIDIYTEAENASFIREWCDKNGLKVDFHYEARTP